MKEVDKGYLYKVHNAKQGMQTIKFIKEGEINDSVQDGTTIQEVLKMLVAKLDFEMDTLDDKSLVLRSSLVKYLKHP